MDASAFFKILIIPNNLYSVILFIIYGLYFIDQKKFYYIGLLTIFSILFCAYLKSVWQIPLNPALNKEGWAYPSTHTVMNVVLHGSLFLFYRKLWVLAISITILLTSFISMVYLGYHTWIDIMAGIATALVLLVPFYYWIRDAASKRVLFGILITMVSVILLQLLPDNVKQWCWKVLGFVIGFIISSELISVNKYSRLIKLVSMGLLSVCVILLSELNVSNIHIYNTLYGIVLASLIFLTPFITKRLQNLVRS